MLLAISNGDWQYGWSHLINGGRTPKRSRTEIAMTMTTAKATTRQATILLMKDMLLAISNDDFALVAVALVTVALFAVALFAITLEFSSPYRISISSPSSLYDFITRISSPLLLHFLAVSDFIAITFVPSLYGMPCPHCCFL
jgi:hypothetical protein